MSANKSVLEYLSTSSQEALEAFRISRLDRVSRLRAKIAELYEQWVQAQVDACAAEWMLDRRGAGDPTPRPRISTRADATSPPKHEPMQGHLPCAGSQRLAKTGCRDS
jgi:hypothetical protein